MPTAAKNSSAAQSNWSFFFPRDKHHWYLDISMKTTAIVIGVLGLLLGAYYGFSSSPNYTKILTYSVICTLFSLVGFALWFLKSTGSIRLLPMTGVVLGLLVLVQSIARLIK